MTRLLCAILIAFLVTTGISPAIAHAGTVVVWLEPQLPDQKTIRKAERRTGSALHLSWLDLAYPPRRPDDDDQARYTALRDAIIRGREHWDEFDVEYGIATELEGILFSIDVVRDRRDLQDLVEGRIFQGAAAARAFSDASFTTDTKSRSFRVTLPSGEANRPWVEAMSLEPGRKFTRSDLADGWCLTRLKMLQDTMTTIPKGTLDLSGIPADMPVVVNGTTVEDPDRKLQVQPGTYYVHVVRNGAISGRQRVRVNSGGTGTTTILVDQKELEEAHQRIVEQTTAGLPEDVTVAIMAIRQHYRGNVMLAALDGKKVVALPIH